MDSNWRDAILVQLACSCGIANRPGAILITIEQHDVVVCGGCGKHGVVQDFLPSTENG